MRSVTTRRFWEAYRRLPEYVQRQAVDSYRMFEADPNHPGLQFKRMGGRRALYSARIGLAYRAVGRMEDGAIVWFWIGTHAEYDRLLRNL